MVTTRRVEPDRADEAETPSHVRVLKKYPNRRLYDTRTSSYITLMDVKRMVLESEDFEVRDAKTGENITRSILLQVILEEESGGGPLFTEKVLSNIIRFYGHSLQGLLGSYLDKNLQSFVDLQAQFAEQSKHLYDPKVFTPDAWGQFLSGQGMLGSYVEQSKTMLMQMQEQFAKQAESLIPGFPGFPGVMPPKR